jgi:AraC-like DNA-binding protein
MSDTSELGVLYTEHSGLRAMTPVSSLWSYETAARGNRRKVARNPDGSHEYWLDRTDPLLNTILPGTGVALVVNFGDPWRAGELLPPVFVAGPVTHARALQVGRRVHAVGAGFPSPMAQAIFGVPAAELVDRIVPLADLWTPGDAARLFASRSIAVMRDELVARSGLPCSGTVGQTAPGLIQLQGGRVSIDDMASSYGFNRQQFARRFIAAAGLAPKLFARITRFQALMHSLLATDVSRWASLATDAGFYDQAHMINEFRAFAGSAPTVFFRPQGSPANLALRGRPSEWRQS